MLSLFLGKERVKSGWDLYPLQRMISEKNFLFFSAGSAPSSTSLLLLSSFACHIFKEASPCQNCQLLLHKLCPLTENWKRLKILKHYASVHIRLRKSIIGYVNVAVNFCLLFSQTSLSFCFAIIIEIYIQRCYITFIFLKVLLSKIKKVQNSLSC